MSSRKTKPKGPGKTYEEAVSEIEGIIDRIESGEMGLEEQIEQYAKGAELLRRCREILERCEQRVEEIAESIAEAESEAGGDE